MSKAAVALAKRAESRILFLHGRKAILDSDLAELYGVTVKRLNEQIKRNAARFPPDFLYQLTRAERDSLRSQIATSNNGRGGRRYLPYAFTEHGAKFGARNSDEHFRSPRLRAHARGTSRKSTNSRKAPGA